MRVFGYCAAVGTTRKDLWPGTGDIPLATTAIGLSVISTDALDASALTGARTIRVDYLDSNYAEGTVNVTMNGVVEVSAGVATCMRAQRMTVLTTGSGNKNAGVISTLVPSGGADQALMPIGFNRGINGVWTCPAGKRGVITCLAFDYAANQDGEGFLLGDFDPDTYAKNAGVFAPLFHANFRFGQYSVDLANDPIIVPEKCAVKLAGVAGAAGQKMGGWFAVTIE